MLRSRVGSRKVWKGRSRKFWKGRSLSRIFNLRLRSPDTGTCVFSRTPPVCKNSSTVYVLDPSSLSLNHSGDSHTDVSNGPIQNLMGYSPDLRSNVILEDSSSLEIVSIEQSNRPQKSFRYPHRK